MTVRHCPYCGTDTDPWDTYCTECGRRISGPDDTAPPGERAPRQRRWHQLLVMGSRPTFDEAYDEGVRRGPPPPPPARPPVSRNSDKPDPALTIRVRR